MMSLKLIGADNTSLVVPRNSWTSGNVYTQYDNSIDLFDPNSGLPPFFVVTDSLNVYKCLDNNNGATSTVEPVGTTTNVVTSADGYQWKYMFTINSGDVLQFVTTDWIPVETLTENDGSLQWQVQQAAVPGTIDRIDLTVSGTQYSQVPAIEITGDGSGATAVATVAGGNVTGVRVTATGENYTWATITFSGGGVGANGAEAVAIIAPFGGHGSDPVTELGGFYVMMSANLSFDENGAFTVQNDYRQIGLIQNPLLNDNATPATATDYNQSVRLTLGSISGSVFNPDETVMGSTSHATGIVMDWNASPNVLRLLQPIGSFVPGETIVGQDASGVLQTIAGTLVSATSNTVVLPGSASSTNGTYNGQTIAIVTGTGNGQVATITGYVGVSRTATISPAWSVTPNSSSTFSIASIVAPDLAQYSGNIIYMENRRPIARAEDQSEALRVVTQF
jgi:hypothetical protein